MRIPHPQTHRYGLGPAMTPMIDVVFLLLIFFLSTTSFLPPEALLPSQLLAAEGTTDASLEPEEIELERIVVTVQNRGGQVQFTVNEQPSPSLESLAALLGQLASIDPSLPVILDIDETAPLGAAVDVYDECRLAGFRRVQFAVPAE